MADTYEKDLAQKSSLTANDFIRLVGSDNVSYKQRFDAVMNGLPNGTNGKLKVLTDTNTDFDKLTSEWTLARSTTNAPTASSYFFVHTIAHTVDANGYLTAGKQIAFSFSSNTEELYTRRCVSGTWYAWQKMLNETQISSLFSYSGLLSSPSVSCAANSVAVMQLTVTPPSGYKLHTIDALFTSSWECPITHGWLDRENNLIGARCYNPTSSAKTVSLYAYVTYIKG